MKFDESRKHTQYGESHPVRGAWIEISTIIKTGGARLVAPREGCVD